MKEKQHLFIIYPGPFPGGMALTNRIALYAKGLSQQNFVVQIIIPNPTENKCTYTNNIQVSGNHLGVDFIYTAGTVWQGNHIISKFRRVLKGNMRAFRLILSTRDVKCVILVSNALYHILWYKCLSWLKGLPLYWEKSELPFVNANNNNALARWYQLWYKRKVFNVFDGIFVISSKLKDYFSAYVREKTRLFQVPVLIDPFEIGNMAVNKESERNIVYAGLLNDKKDGIISIIKSFAIFCQKQKDVQLIIIGDTKSKAEKEKIVELIHKEQLSERVLLTGYIKREELITYLLNAGLLILAKPGSLQAEYCFPSKIAEYLITGNAVLTTNLGAVSEYLQDGKNAFLAEPGNIESMAGKMEYIFEHYDEAREVGRNGRKLALESFDYAIHTQRMTDFINEYGADG